MVELPLTYLESKMLFTRIGNSPCKVTDEALQFRFSCGTKILIMLGLFNSIEEYQSAMSVRGEVLYFDRRLSWDIDGDLTAIVDMRDDKGVVNSVMVLLKGDGADHIKDALKGNLGGKTPHQVFSDRLLIMEFIRMARASLVSETPHLGVENTPQKGV